MRLLVSVSEERNGRDIGDLKLDLGERGRSAKDVLRARLGRFVLDPCACAPPGASTIHDLPSAIHDLPSTIQADRRFGLDVAEMGMGRDVEPRSVVESWFD